MNTPLEAVAASIDFPKRKLTVCSIYIPPNSVFTENQFRDLIRQLPKPFLILGDFNAKHGMWGSGLNDSRGLMMTDVIFDEELLVLNDGSPTCIPDSGRDPSCIDISLCSYDIAKLFNWNVCEDLNDSDHYPIFLKSEVELGIDNRRKWKLDTANWLTFSNLISLPENFLDVNESCHTITNNIVSAAHHSIKRSSGKINIRYHKCWWNDGVEAVVQDRKRALRQFRRCPTPENLANYKKFRAIARKTIKIAKRDSWRNFVSSIADRTSVSDLWRKIKSLKGKSMGNKRIVLNVRNGIFTDANMVGNILCEHFSKASSVLNFREPFLSHLLESELFNVDGSSNNTEAYNGDITLSELKFAINNCSDSTPGIDEVHYSFFKHLNDVSLSRLLLFFNFIWCNEVFPDDWKISLIVPILKPGKLPADSKSYRPIALTSCLCKLLEKILNLRLCRYLESYNLLHPWQSGFRKRRCTFDCLVRLENNIRLTFLRNEFLFGVFIDIEKAYDMVWHHGLLRKLANLNIKGHMFRFLENFINCRYIKVLYNGVASDSKRVTTGLPQGSILSPLLFNVYINDIFDGVDEGVDGSLYADDCAFWIGDNNFDVAYHKVQDTLNCIAEWSNRWGLMVSGNKSSCVVFSKRRVPPFVNFTINDQEVNQCNSVKFLGMVFDSKLTWEKHIKYIIGKCSSSFNLLCMLSHTTWGADRCSLLKIYKSLIRSILDYCMALLLIPCCCLLIEFNTVVSGFVLVQ